MEHNVHSICQTLKLCRLGWRDHTLRMHSNYSAKTMWNCKPRGCCAIGKLGEMWWEQFNGVRMDQIVPGACGCCWTL